MLFGIKKRVFPEYIRKEVNTNMLLRSIILLAWMMTTVRSETGGGDVTEKSVKTTLTFDSFTLVTVTSPQLKIHLFNPTAETMDLYIQTQKHVIDYLASFRNEFQRYVVETQMKFCPYETLCNFSVDASTDKESCCQPCSCDKSICKHEKTCCPSIMNEEEFRIATSNLSTPFQTENKTVRLEETGDSVEQTCVLQHLTYRPSYEKKGFLAYYDCPADTDPLLKENCSRPYTKDMKLKSTLPVLSNSSLDAFRNRYCAFCNGLVEKELVYFRSQLSCAEEINMFDEITSEKDMIDLVFATEECDIKFVNMDTRMKLQECKYFISQCNVTGLWTEYDEHLQVACQAYRSEFSLMMYLFRNIFCAMCNGVNPHTVTCETIPTLKTDTFSFSGLLKLDYSQGFSTSNLEDGDTVHESSCNENQILDELTDQCKDLFCSEMRMVRNGQCVNLYDSVENYFKYILYIRVKPVTQVTIADSFQTHSSLLHEIQRMFQEMYPYMDLCDSQMTFKVNKHYDESVSKDLPQTALLYVDARVCLAENSIQPWTTAGHLLKLHGTSFESFFGRNESTKFKVYVMDDDDRIFKLIEDLLPMRNSYYDYKSDRFINLEVEILSQYALSDTDGLTLLPYSLQYSPGQSCLMAHKEINVVQLSACPKVNVSKLDISWTRSVDGLKFENMNVQSDKYYFTDPLHIMICVETFRKIVDHLRPKRSLNTEIIVSILSCFLSVVCLLITLIIFSIFSKLRTSLPGKNNMSLAASLMISQVLLLVGSLAPFQQFSLSCKIVGLLIHFSWLYTLFLMNVCTYHMFRVLSRTRKLFVGSGWKRLIAYHIYVCTMSVAFVLANVISSHFIDGNLGYGGKFCYIVSREKVLFTFGIPVFFVIVVNLLMFLFVVIKIRGQPNIRKNVQHDRNDIAIFAKLSTITGSTWLFGFLYIWTGIQAFSYIFIILNGGQGVFIMLAFVVNRHILSLCREFRSKRQRKRLLKSNENANDIRKRSVLHKSRERKNGTNTTDFSNTPNSAHGTHTSNKPNSGHGTDSSKITSSGHGTDSPEISNSRPGTYSSDIPNIGHCTHSSDLPNSGHCIDSPKIPSTGHGTDSSDKPISAHGTDSSNIPNSRYGTVSSDKPNIENGTDSSDQPNSGHGTDSSDKPNSGHGTDSSVKQSSGHGTDSSDKPNSGHGTDSS